MSKIEIKGLFDPECPIRNVLSRIADKWTLLVLYNLSIQTGKIRFGELKRLIPDISQKSLTKTLRTLEEDGFVTREVYAEVAPRVEYAMTDRARSLFTLIQQLILWAKENMGEIMADRENNKKERP